MAYPSFPEVLRPLGRGSALSCASVTWPRCGPPIGFSLIVVFWGPVCRCTFLRDSP